MGLKNICMLLVAAAAIASAQPGIAQNGVANAASQIPPTLAGGSIARGALFTIRGVRLAATAPTSVVLRHDRSEVPVTVLKAEPRRIEALMPPQTPTGPGALIVTLNGLASRPFPVEIAASNPGIFSQNQEGWGPGQIENLGPAASLNTFTNPAHPGQRVRIATTGMGDLHQPVVVIGNRRVTGVVARSDRKGEERITVEIPADAPLSCWVPLYLLAAPGRASNVVTIAISRSAKCDPGPVPMDADRNLAIIALSRSRLKADGSDQVIDNGKIVVKRAGQRVALARNDLVPPPGTCTAATGSYQGDDLTVSLSTLGLPRGEGLDAGASLTLSAGGQTRSLEAAPGRPGSYQAKIGMSGVDLRRQPLALILNPGQILVSAPGGVDVGPFSTSLSIAPPFIWTNRDQLAAIDRNNGVTLRWEKTPPGQRMLILARNVDLITTAVGTCLCAVPPGAGQFSIPAELLANIPASIPARGERFDKLAIGSLAVKPLSFHTKGLDKGFVFVLYDISRTVDYR